jgi:hypothetical protein
MVDRYFKGVWSVIARENRVRGEWQRVDDYGPNDWSVSFLPLGRYLEILRPASGKIGRAGSTGSTGSTSNNVRKSSKSGKSAEISGRWVFDDRSGLLAFGLDSDPAFLHRCVFECDDPDPEVPASSGWLYFYADDCATPLDRASIVAHHATDRRRLRRVGPTPSADYFAPPAVHVCHCVAVHSAYKSAAQTQK